MRYRSADQIGPEHVGRRVTVRRKLSEGGYSDVIGVCEQVDASSVTVRNKQGESIVIGRAEIVAARVINAQPRNLPDSE